MDSETWTYVIGDIHGCYDEVLALEDRIQRHALKQGVKPFVVSVGDLVDRGPRSLDVIRHFQRGVEAGTHAVVGGNHEAFLFEVLIELFPHLFESLPCATGNGMPLYAIKLKTRYQLGSSNGQVPWPEFVVRMRNSWLFQGGSATMKSFGCDPLKMETWSLPMEELTFLFQLPLLWENEKVVVTHALATAEQIAYARWLQSANVEEVRWDSQEHMDMIAAVTWNRQRPTQPVDVHRPHVSGHTPRPKGTILKRSNSVLVDTGCAYGNRLSAWCVEVNQFLSVQAEERRGYQLSF